MLYGSIGVKLVQDFKNWCKRSSLNICMYLIFENFKYETCTNNPDTPTAKARWVLIYIHFQIYSKVYETNEFL